MSDRRSDRPSDPRDDSPRDDSLARVYRAGSAEEPPGHLDDAILAASRRAVGARPRSRWALAEHRWTGPVAVAAMVVLTATISVLVHEEQLQPRPMDPVIEKTEKSAVTEPAPPSEPPAPSPPRKTAPQPPAAAKPARAAEAERRDAARESMVEERPPAAPAPLLRPASPAARAESQGAGSSRASATASFADSARAVPSPEAWIETLRKLKAEGRLEEVERELEAFKRRYPLYALPDDLRQP